MEPDVEIWRQCFYQQVGSADMMLWQRQFFPSCECPGGVVSACLLVIWDHAPSEIMRGFFFQGAVVGTARSFEWQSDSFLPILTRQLESNKELRAQAHTNGERQCCVNML